MKTTTALVVGCPLSRFRARQPRGNFLQAILLILLAVAMIGKLAPRAAAQTTTGTESVLYSLCSQGGGTCTDGSVFFAGLIQGSDGNFYGVTGSGGASNAGTVFKVTPSGTYTILYSFCSQGGSNCTDGVQPDGSLVEGNDGNFYGTTVRGGVNSTQGGQGGTIFKITPSGTLATLYSFCSQGGSSCTDGSNPDVGLVQGTDGSFYGTASEGGIQNEGVIFKISPSGTYTNLYSVCSQASCTDGAIPLSPLLQGSDGNFYGTTNNGGANSTGVVFRITPSGSYTVIYNFCGQGGTACTDGASPFFGRLIEAGDGNFYGLTDSGGAGQAGIVFKVTPSGTLTTLYSFCASNQNPCPDGANPDYGLIQGSDGNFYGATFDAASQGAGNNGGTVFQITTAGALTTLYTFCSQGGTACTDGNNPTDLIQGSDGNIYGTTNNGGANNQGAIFKLALSPALSAPVQLSLSSAQVNPGTAVALNWQVINGASDTMQQCYASVQNAPAGAGTWSGLQTGTVSNGVYSGSASITPTVAGTYTYALTCGGMESGFATLTVGAAQPLSITTTSLPAGTTGVAYSQSLAATGGVAPYTWSGTGLPAGLAIGPSGTVSGTPSTSGAYSFTASVSDSESTPQTASATVSIAINQPAVVTLSASPVSGVTYGQTVGLSAQVSGISGGAAQGYSWSVYDNGTALVTGAPSSGPNSFSMTTPALSAGENTFTATYSSTVAGNPSATSNPVAVNVGKAATTTALTASSSSDNLDGSVTFNAAVTSSSAGTPTGSVQFMSGSTALSTATLSGGTAAYTTTGLPAGTDGVTAVYSGDANFSSSTSSAVQVVVTAPAFTLSASPSSVTIAAGQSGTASITLTPVGGFSGNVSLSCSGLPQNSSCSFKPSSLNADGSNAALSTTVTIATNVSSTSASLKNAQPEIPSRNRLPMLAGFSFAGLALLFGFRRRVSAARRLRGALLLFTVLALGSFTVISGCGGSSSPKSTQTGPVTPAGTSNVVITASAGTGSAQQTLKLPVTVTN